MDTLDINRNGLVASRVGLGTWAMGGWMWGGTSEAASIRTIQSVAERGVSLIDTAPVYGFGRAEELVGKAVAQAGLRDRLVLATKCGLEWDDSGNVQRNASAARIAREVDDSRRRLRTDVIDLLQVHWPDPRVDIRETAEAMAEAKAAGKIRAIGVSNFSPRQMAAFERAAPLDVTQNPYNLFERQIDESVLPVARARNTCLLAYGALCRGLLSGRMTSSRRFPGDDLRNRDPKFQQPRLDRYLAAVRALDAFARERYGKRVLDLAIRWLLDRYERTVALWGARTPEQMAAVAGVAGWRLDADARAEMAAIVDRHVTDPVGPEFMAPPLG